MVKVYIALFTWGEDQWILNESKIGCKSEREHCSCILLGTTVVMLPLTSSVLCIRDPLGDRFIWFLFLCVYYCTSLILRLDELLWEGAHTSRARPLLSPLDFLLFWALVRSDCAGGPAGNCAPQTLLISILLVRMIIYLKLYSLTLFTTFFGIEYLFEYLKRMYMFFTLCLDTFSCSVHQ